MGKENVEKVEAPVVGQEGQQAEPPKTVAEVHIRVLENGGISLHMPEEYRQLEVDEVEQVVRTVFEQLHDARIARLAVDMFKARLG